MALSSDEIKRLVALEATAQGVDPRLALGVAQQESAFDPAARSPKGALSIMQLMPGTAKMLGVDPSNVADNIRGGVTYLKQQLTRYGGDQARALAAYNAGPGAVDRYNGVPPYTETQGYVQRILGTLSPARAEAAAGGLSAQEQQRLQALEAELARRETAAPPVQPQAAPRTPPPTARATPEHAAAYREYQARQQGAPPQSVVDPRASQGPSPTEPSDLVIDIEKESPAGPAPPQAPARANPSLPPGVPSVEQETLQEGFTRPTTMIPLLMGGAGVKAVTKALPEIAPWFGRVLRPVTEGVSQTLGWGTGRTIETGQVPSASELGPEAALNIGTGAVFEGLHGAVQQRLRRSPAGRAMAHADAQTVAAQTRWQQEVEAAQQAQQQGQKEAYDEAVIRAKVAQRDYQMARTQREQTIAANQQAFDEAQQQALEGRYTQARDTATQQQATYHGQVAQQTADVGAQQQALQTARAVPGRYAPGTPSWVLYEKFGDAAKDATVDMVPAKTALAEVRAARGVLPDGTPRPFPSAVESMASTLERAEGPVSVQTIRNELRRLGPLTRSADGNVRGPAKQLYGVYADALEASPVANDLLRHANATFRREMALQEVSDWLKPGHGVVRIDQQGRQQINVGALLTRLEKQVGDDTQFARSFPPDDLQALRGDFQGLAGTPRMPTRTLTAPQPELLPGAAGPGTGTQARAPAAVPLPADVRVKQVPEPTSPPPPEAVTPRQALGARPKFLGPRAGEWGAILATMQAMGVPTAPLAVAAGLHVTGRQARWLMANALLDPKRRPLMQAALDGQMRLNPRVYGALVATLSPADKKQYQRETRERR